MDNVLTALVIALVIGIPLGLYVSLVSNRHVKVRGGLPAQIFHALASILLCTALPGVLAMVFVARAGFLNVIGFGLSAFALAYLSLCVYAVFERPTLQTTAQEEDRGWTAEKAKSSGL
ncbi:MAG: hypothetical protein U0670_08515 [Anaerolineae bacterium]